MDLSAVAINELSQWIGSTCKQVNTDQHDDGITLHSYEGMLFQVFTKEDSESVCAIKIFKKEAQQEGPTLGMIMQFIQNEETRIDIVNKEVFDEIQAIISSDKLAKDLTSKVDLQNDVKPSAKTMLMRQYG